MFGQWWLFSLGPKMYLWQKENLLEWWSLVFFLLRRSGFKSRWPLNDTGT